MIHTKYKPISEQLCENYMSILIDGIFKILPLKEENNPTVEEYISSLISEMVGFKNIVDVINNDGRYLKVICSLESIMNCTNIVFCKKEIFKCINIIDKLKYKYFAR